MKRSYDYNDEYYNSYLPGSKRYRTERFVPIRNPSTNSQILDYEDLIDSSTSDFQSKHLILDFQDRQRLLWLCDDLLGSKYEQFLHVPFCTELYDALENACRGQAWRRLRSILNHGFFNAGEYPAETNTLIVSARERMLCHIERSNFPGYALFVRIVQKKTCEGISYHLTCDGNGKIDHYRP